MSDQDIIHQAYAEALRGLFNLFFDSSTVAKNAEDRKKAEERFKAGVAAARKIRDRATELVA